MEVDKLNSVKEAADKLNITPRTLRDWLNKKVVKGFIKTVTKNGRIYWYIRNSELMRIGGTK